MWAAFKRTGRYTLIGAGGLAPIVAYEAYTYRPRASFDVDFHEKMRGVDRLPSNAVDRFFYDLSMTIIAGGVSTLFHVLTHSLHDVELLDHHKLLQYLRQDRGGIPLITVANHQSTLDDPMFQSAILPADVRWSASKMRWGVCTEEICFSSPGVASFMGMGKALPIQRGGSIHQKAMATLQAKVNAGEWVHVYPEARIWQEDGTPQRDEQGRWCSAGGRCGPPWQKVGPMKWGVGKIIANASTPPIVLPYYHQGMAYVRPQKRDNDYQTDWPVFNVKKKLTVKFGDPIDVSDLIASYHASALGRALARNSVREKQLEEAVKRAASTAAATATAAVAAAAIADSTSSDGGWSRYFAFWRHIPGFRAPSSSNNSSHGSDGGSSNPTNALVPPSSRPVHTVEMYSDHTGASAHLYAAAPFSSSSVDSQRQQRPLSVPSRVDPINTVEEASDHTGASAHVAGLATPAPPGQLAADAAREAHSLHPLASRARDTLTSIETSFSDLESRVTRSAEQLEAAAAAAAREVEAKAHEARAVLQARARAMEASAKQQAEAIEAAVTETADAIEGRARELVHSLKHLQEALARHETVVKRKTDGSTEMPDRHAELDSRPSPAPAPAVAAGMKHRNNNAGSASTSSTSTGSSTSSSEIARLREALDSLSARWGNSVSVPAPPKVVARADGQGRPLPVAAPSSEAHPPDVHEESYSPAERAEITAGRLTSLGSHQPHLHHHHQQQQRESSSRANAADAGSTGSPVAAPPPPSSSLPHSRASSSTNGGGGSPSPLSIPLPSGASFPLSDEPVVEIVPTRVLRTGATVPTYIEAPLRIKPPDHLFLSPEEAAAEETHRLQLYSDITARISDAVAGLEREVMAHRAAQGIAEERPMK